MEINAPGNSEQKAKRGRPRKNPGKNGNPPPHNPVGRPRGALNKLTFNIKAAIEEVFVRSGGTDTMLAWAMHPDNQTAFYNLVGRLLPRDIKITVEPVRLDLSALSSEEVELLSNAHHKARIAAANRAQIALLDVSDAEPIPVEAAANDDVDF